MTSFVQYNATMATASMTIASNSVDHNSSITTASVTDQHIESRTESIEKLRSSLVRYARCNDRRMVLRSLKEHKFLEYTPLETPVDQIDIPMSELEKEVSDEKIVLNDVVLQPRHSADSKGIIVNSGTNNGCIMTLKALSKVLCDKSALDEKTLYERLLVRLAKTSASADVCFQLNSVMGSADLIVQQLCPEYIVKSTFVNTDNNTTNNDDDAIHLNMYNYGGQIHIILDMTFNFGLFRKNDVASNRPWIIMKGKVHERANLSTNKSSRSLNVKTPNLY
mmetsp:Transcript_39712/g.44747  ORF Transcript_39712/g.44747 Transcript_39712/m.44747 type:complete len:279 (+) Transcript_39712:80-916(+)